MRIARSRTLRAPAPDGLARARGSLRAAALVAARAAGGVGERRRAGRRCSAKEGGRGVRADQRLEASEPERLRRWALAVPGSPFERVLSASVTEARLAPAAGGARADARAAPVPARLGALRPLPAAPRRAAPARRGARRHGAGGRAVSREQKFWGWGEPGAGPALPDHAAGLLREWLGVSGAVVSRPVALERRAAAPAGRRRGAAGGGWRRAVGAEHVRDDARGPRAARGRQVLPRPAGAARGTRPRTRRTWSSRRPPTRRSRPCCTRARRRARR